MSGEAVIDKRTKLYAWLIAVFPLLGFWTYGLFDLDEGFYAAVTGEMIRRSEWITPYYNGVPWFEKPILLYWLAKPCIMLFGDSIGPRLPSVICTLLLGAVLWNFGRRFFGDRSGMMAMLVWSTSLIVVGVGRMMMTDMPLVLCFTLALLTFYRSLFDGVRWRWWSALFLGLSVLAKGPVSCAHFVLILGIFYWLEPSLRAKFKGGWLLGILIFAATVSIWYVPCYLANRDLFVEEFLIKQNIGRFAGGDVAHAARGVLGLIFYIPVLALGMVPWFLWFVFRKEEKTHKRPEIKFALIWFWVVFLFYTVSGSKLPHYILACVPAVAVVVGDWLARRRPTAESVSNSRLLVVPAIVSVVVGIVANAAFILWYNESHRQLHQITIWAGKQDGMVVEYQLSRRSGEASDNKLALSETSHPSISFYLDRVIPDAESIDNLARFYKMHFMIITRKGRLGIGDVQRATSKGFVLSRLNTPYDRADEPGDYEIWSFKPISAQ